MWSLIKIVVVLVIVVIGAQLVLGFIGNLIGDNRNVRASWQGSELDAPEGPRRLPKSSSLEFIPEPLRGWTFKGRDFVVSGWYKGKRACQSAYTSLQAKLG